MQRHAVAQDRHSSARRQRGAGLVEVLVALFVFGLAAAVFLGVMAGMLGGTARAAQVQGAVTCAGYVVESVRAGLLSPADQPQEGSCAAAGWPRLGYRLESDSGNGPGVPGGTRSRWPVITVTVFPEAHRETVLYRVVTVESLETAGP